MSPAIVDKIVGIDLNMLMLLLSLVVSSLRTVFSALVHRCAVASVILHSVPIAARAECAPVAAVNVRCECITE